jgi:hypothetical protein
MNILFENVRISFPRIIQPEVNKAFPNSPAKYSADFIMPPNHPKIAEFMQEVSRLAQEKWKTFANNVLQEITNSRKMRCYGPGEEVVNSTTFKMYDGYGGMFHISAGADAEYPPQIIKGDTTVAHNLEREVEARKLYGGCYVNVVLSPWLQDNAGGRAIRCQLVAVQFCRDGEAFGEGTPDVTGMFSQVAGSAPAPAAPFAPLVPPFMG